eukprot:TRINITY_DN4702_c0_g1_i1.p1 TRINITY_DN4702_c0_g1~~TRINITY_DN4702_c0_g1_i1.p1  ORF type:complete len:288 (-),score=76.17 TRINITY_DN4702_c0_g1_i1:118-921(-)
MCIRDRSTWGTDFITQNRKGMYVLINYGYKLNKIYSTDCLLATLMDYIWTNSYKDIIKQLQSREELFNKEIKTNDSRRNALEKKLENVTRDLIANDPSKAAQFKAEASKPADPKAKAAPPPKKGGKEVTVVDPKEQERLELLRDIERCRENVEKYKKKLEGLKLAWEKYSALEGQLVVLDLVDKTGERKYTKTKLEQRGSQVLNEKGIYYLARVIPGEKPEDEELAELLNLDGAFIRTVEEDEVFVDAPEVVLKGKQDKKGKKGGAK